MGSREFAFCQRVVGNITFVWETYTLGASYFKVLPYPVEVKDLAPQVDLLHHPIPINEVPEMMRERMSKTLDGKIRKETVWG